MAATDRPVRPDFPTLVTDGVTAAFGSWTVVSTLTTIFGGTPRVALNAGALLLLVLGVAAIAYRRFSDTYVTDARATEALADSGLPWPAQAALAAAIPLTIVLWLVTKSGLLVWTAAVLLSAACSWIGLRQPVQAPRPAEPLAIERWERYVLHGAAIACALFTLLAFRPRTDDAFYVHMAISIADQPSAPLLAQDLIHGPPGGLLPPQEMFPPYRVHAFETLAGYISYLTGIEAAGVLHIGFATFFGWLVPFAIGRLLQLLIGRAWLPALLVTLAYYVIEGTASRGYANLAFVRMFHGKSVLLTVAIPLVMLYGLRFGLRPTRIRFALLALAQIGAVGLSSTGLWLAPLFAVLAVVAGSELRAAPRVLPYAVLSSAYVVALGLWVRSNVLVDPAAPIVAKGVAAGASGAKRGFALLEVAMPEVLGGRTTALALIAVFALACVLAERVAALRLFALLGLLCSAVMANPWLSKLIASTITGKLTYERIFWLLPVPIAVGLCFVAIGQRLNRRIPAFPAALVASLAVIALLGFATKRAVISEANNAWLRYPPVLKQWPKALAAARAACRVAPEGTSVVAPREVSHALGSLHHCGYPLMAEVRWMKAPAEEQGRRNVLVRYVSTDRAPSDKRARDFAASLDRYRPAAIVTSWEGMNNRRVKSLMRRGGYKKLRTVADFTIWTPLPASSLGKYTEVARKFCQHLSATDVVLAPFAISQAIAERGCAKAPLGSRGPLPTDVRSIELLDLEGFFALDRRYEPEQRTWLRDMIDADGTRAVVLTEKAMENAALKKLLGDLDFTKAERASGFRLYLRTPSTTSDGGPGG